MLSVIKEKILYLGYQKRALSVIDFIRLHQCDNLSVVKIE
jgi:hypothetical protein